MPWRQTRVSLLWYFFHSFFFLIFKLFKLLSFNVHLICYLKHEIIFIQREKDSVFDIYTLVRDYIISHRSGFEIVILK